MTLRMIEIRKEIERKEGLNHDYNGLYCSSELWLELLRSGDMHWVEIQKTHKNDRPSLKN